MVHCTRAWEWNKRYESLSLDTQVLATKTSQLTPTQLPPLSSSLLLDLLMAYLDTVGQIDASWFSCQTIGMRQGLGPINPVPA